MKKICEKIYEYIRKNNILEKISGKKIWGKNIWKKYHGKNIGKKKGEKQHKNTQS